MDFYQVCEVCLEQFLSPRRAVSLCPFHDEEVKAKRTELEGLAQLAMQSPNADIREEFREVFWDRLTCHEREGPLGFSGLEDDERRQEHVTVRDSEDTRLECGWYGNRNREDTENDLRLLIPSLKKWIIRLLQHQMRHRFPGRFPISPKFTPKWLLVLNEWEGQSEADLINTLLNTDSLKIILADMLRTLAGGTRNEPRRSGENLPAFRPA